MKQRRRVVWRAGGGLAALALVLSVFLRVGIQPASAAVTLAVTPTFPSQITVGQSGVAASVTVRNASTAPESAGTVTVTQLTVVPSCGVTVTAADCPAASVELGVFRLSATGAGAAATACAGETFQINVVNPADGKVQFVPLGAPIVLGPPGQVTGGFDTCTINFTIDALKVPTKAPPAATALAAASARHTDGQVGTGGGSTVTNVIKARPTLSTTASAGKIGGTISDIATLAGPSPPAVAPTGTLTFNVYPGGVGCDAVPLQTTTTPVTRFGTSTSAPFTPAGLGTYDWRADYSGDANYLPTPFACADPNETSRVTQATPTVTTAARTPVSLGQPITDVATLSGGFRPTGTLRFDLLPACGAQQALRLGQAPVGPLPSSTVAVAGNGTYTSAPVTGLPLGTYQFVVAYSGDANNGGFVTSCGTEPVVVTQAGVSISSNARLIQISGSPGTVPVNTIVDTATLRGAVLPTGTVVFKVFGPNDTNCARPPAFVSTTALVGQTTATSPTFRPTGAGRYRFTVTYSGDLINAAAVSGCNAPNETVLAGQTTPNLSTATSGPVQIGTGFSDTATLTSGDSPTGTMTFRLFGPDDATCSRPLTTSTAAVTGNGTYRSGIFKPTATGTFRYIASYSGDANDAPVSGLCGDPAESVAVQAAPVAPTTATIRPIVTAPRTTTPPTTTPATSAVPATTTLPPTTTTTLPPPPPVKPPGVALVVVSLAGKSFGPAGVGVNVNVSDLPSSCSTAYFFFGGTRIGSAPVHQGRAAAGGLSVPGDAKAGVHQVSTSCQGSGQPVLRSTVFRVKPSSVHRSAFVTSINEPRQLSLTLKSVGFSALVTALLLVLLGFPSQIFNATLQDHYEEVRGWFGLRRPLSEVVQGMNQRVLFPVFLIVGGILYSWLTPDFGFNLSSLALALGLAIAVAVTTVGFALPTFTYFGVRFHDRGRVLVLPGTVAIGAMFVLLSRLMHFQPGYLYGLLAVFVFRHEVDKRTGGRLAAVAALSVLGLALIAWFGRVPLSGANMGPGVGFWTILLESALGGAFVIGLESTVVGLLPLRFLDGARIKAWSRTAWGILFALALFVLVEVLIQPGSGYVGHTSTPAKIAVAVLYVVFAAFSTGFWAYFRYRRPRAEASLATQGGYGVR